MIVNNTGYLFRVQKKMENFSSWMKEGAEVRQTFGRMRQERERRDLSMSIYQQRYKEYHSLSLGPLT